MYENIQDWKVKHLILMLADLNLQNRKLFNFMTKLREVYDSKNGYDCKRDLPGKITLNTSTGFVAFRMRGQYLECESCGKYINSGLVNVHLRTKHGISVIYF